MIAKERTAVWGWVACAIVVAILIAVAVCYFSVMWDATFRG